MKTPITKDGYENIKKQLENLLGEKRPKILKAIEEARGHGDLSENAEYDAAKEAYELLQKKISELEEILKNSEVIEVREGKKTEVVFGCLVVLKNLDTEEMVNFRVVGPHESDVKNGKISVYSPIGKALLGKSIGDQVTFSAPSGEKYYEIIDIQ